MTTASTMTFEVATIGDLLAAGLSLEQIKCMIEARERYTAIHDFFTKREFQRLLFLRWQYENGRIENG
jgi:hypothetical protein